MITDSKYLTKPSKDWQPHIPTANTDTAYIEVQLRFCVKHKDFYSVCGNKSVWAGLGLSDVKFLYANILAIVLTFTDRTSESHIHER